MSISDRGAGAIGSQLRLTQDGPASLPTPPTFADVDFGGVHDGREDQSGAASAEQNTQTEILPPFAQSLAVACAEIDDIPELAGEGSAEEEARILRKLKAHARFVQDDELPPDPLRHRGPACDAECAVETGASGYLHQAGDARVG